MGDVVWDSANRPDIAWVGRGTGGLGLSVLDAWVLGEVLDRSMLNMRGTCK